MNVPLEELIKYRGLIEKLGKYVSGINLKSDQAYLAQLSRNLLDKVNYFQDEGFYIGDLPGIFMTDIGKAVTPDYFLKVL